MQADAGYETCNGKTDGVQYYHIIQSFKPGEVTPELALEIAREFAAEHLRLPGGHRRPCGQGAHPCPYHLQFRECGYRREVHSNARSYYSQIRAISDRLCREHGLSVISLARPPNP